MNPIHDRTSDYHKYLKVKQGDSDLFKLTVSDKRYIWYNPDPDERDSYECGEIVSETSDSFTFKTVDGQDRQVKKDDANQRNPIKFDGVEDMSELSYLNEPAVFHNLRVRYNQDLIYTYSGLFLVAVNPFKRIPIYTQEMVDIFKGRRRNEVAPHIFAISDVAYRSMLDDRQNQSLLITGESGAGKTENTKKVIQYLASVAGRNQANGSGVLEQQILQANPILEAFGNAKTTRNNNSSEFGKFIEIQFNNAGFISGASIQSYLLEKSRVVFQSETERNYHIFYQLLAGATAEEKKALHLAGPESFNYLNQSGCVDIKGVSDEDEFKITRQAMDIVGFSQEEQMSIFKIIAGILHLGNIKFEKGAGEGAVLKDKTALNAASTVFGVNPSVLEKALMEPRILAGRDLVAQHLNVEKSSSSRDALVKALYGRLFLWLVKKINNVLCSERKAYFIGVLDISGFEIFKVNSFEQLCINYTNEKLQQFFNHHMFKVEQEEYLKEKINWTFIDFGLDSQATIDLIDGRQPPGILALLDEQSVFPNATDNTLITKLHSHFSKKNAKYEEPRFSKTEFGVTHYAGQVMYEIQDWLEKNKDPLQQDLELCFKDSSDNVVTKLFNDPNIASRAKKGANFITVAAQYKEQLASLMATLETTNPHFVRCIIPNNKQLPAKLEDKVVLDQLRCNGVLEGIRITRKGFPNRIIYADFVKRYYLLAPNVPRDAEDSQKATDAVLKHLNIDPEQYRFGITKIFFRAGQLARIEEAREQRLGSEQTKSDYLKRANELVQWINDKQASLESRDFGDSIESVQSFMNAHKEYKKTEKPPKGQEVSELEAIYNSLQTKLRLIKREPFVAPAGLTPNEIDSTWSALEKAEQEHAEALRIELKRQKKIAVLLQKYNRILKKLENWATTKSVYLGSNETGDSITAVQAKLKNLEAFDGECQSLEGQSNSDLLSILAQLTELNYNGVPELTERKDTFFAQQWTGVKSSAETYKNTLLAELERLQKIEDLHHHHHHH
uniref:MYOSIN II HEAVY CHAIN FUSED TO ALPHA-ACTININ 3 n=1 Tax=Dictyostelium discoideum TaxID=44689 RepID=UPI0000113053|nr:Chain A, MYOSIN II HEAVY CHAIN FUSED TO ALPHA-ACTININ 3 [Dictyostelium discoideum]1G8X_B Chain B, MYOSIN II HEAVY CHAIN FUSED TO ALPHA-ACTININ 3 [Dictyostelium discoideum]